jgi:hypothetical protein
MMMPPPSATAPPPPPTPRFEEVRDAGGHLKEYHLDEYMALPARLSSTPTNLDYFFF